MQPEKFLNKFDNIVFEPEGVITSDSHRLLCAVLAVYEICNSEKYYGKSSLNFSSIYSNQKQISDLLLCSGKLPAVFNDLGIDHPIDIAYVLISGILGLGERRDFLNICNYFRYIDLHTPEIFEHSAVLLGRCFPHIDCKKGGAFWQNIANCYYEWLYGDELYEAVFGEEPENKGKPSIISTEKLCCSITNLKDIFSVLGNSHKLSLYSTRTRSEIAYFLNKFNLTDTFPIGSYICYEDIVDSGRLPNINTPAKPDVYPIARCAIGPSFSYDSYFKGKYDSKLLRTLVVSSSEISLFVSQTLGAGFAAVVDDPTNKVRRDIFRHLEADRVFHSISDLIKE
ncbi:MAG: hypothetical protein IJC89_02735 [Clostridia bacterium]|nr:hypothetical protein [Clostridia bacterium]